jgi:pyruvate kinase
VSEKDISDILLGIREGADFVAASFVRKADDIHEIRRIIEQTGGDMHIIAKIENAEGVENIDDILAVADGLMVARGDLGVEIPSEEVPLLQKTMIEKARRLGKPVITATQMLESMVAKPRPTRAEASDVANAIFDGTDALMLSAETTVGKYPVESVKMMATIAERTERALNFTELLVRRAETKAKSVTDAISHATCTTAAELDAHAIITATQSGLTTRMVARYRPQAPVIAVTWSPRVQRKLALVWGAKPVIMERADDSDALLEGAIGAALGSGLIKEGDMVVMTMGLPAWVTGTTNTVQVRTVGSIVLRGTGIGSKPATGRVRIYRSPADAVKFSPGDILVAVATHGDLTPLIEKAGGVITEEGGLSSHAASVCVNLAVPAVVGAKGATVVLKQGTVVTIDPAAGLVYLGSARV